MEPGACQRGDGDGRVRRGDQGRGLISAECVRAENRELTARGSLHWGGISTKRSVGLFFLTKFHKLSGALVDYTLDRESAKPVLHTKDCFVENNRFCRQRPNETQTCFVDGNRFCSLRIKGRPQPHMKPGVGFIEGDGPQFINSDQLVDLPTSCRLGANL
jgi:hypothetical protein